MHNKSFTVDGTLSVVGGRNIGDEYFDLSVTGERGDTSWSMTGDEYYVQVHFVVDDLHEHELAENNGPHLGNGC